MRSLSRSTFVVIAALMLGIAFSATSAMAQQTANDAAGRRLSNKLAITEFRADGPSGTSDEFVEICNVSDAAFTILRDTGETGAGVTGIGVYSFQQATNNIIKLFSIKDGVVFQPGQCFLGTGSSYSLGGYAGGTSDVTFSNVLLDPTGASILGAALDGIPHDTGVAIFGTDQATFGTVSGLPAVCLSGGCTPGASAGLATIEDAIGFNVVNTITFPGFAAPSSPIFREGRGLTPIDVSVANYAWVRRSCGVQGTAGNPKSSTLGTCGATPDKEGVVQDTDTNNNDFFGLETGANVATNSGGTVVRSGQPVAPNSTANTRNANPGKFTFSDFGGVLTPASTSPGPVVAILGSPGPESFTGNDGNTSPRLGAPRKRRFGSAVPVLNLTTALFDTTAGTANTIPNRERWAAVPRPGNRADGTVVVPADNNEASSPLGTFALRFTIRNTIVPAQAIARLRWRLMDGTVSNRPTTDSGPSAPFEVAVAGQPFADLRLISSTTARVFVGTGTDQNCTFTSPTPAGSTACLGAGFKLSQGTILDSTQPAGTSAGNVGASATTNPGAANTIPVGAPLGNGINAGLVVENNTIAGSGAGIFPVNGGVGTPPAGVTNRASGVPRGNGTLVLATPLASGQEISVEFRFGVQVSGRFYLMIEPEADNCTGTGVAPCSTTGGAAGNQ